MEFEYDSWNRIQSMTYPDGEVVSYGYNIGGMLDNITGVKNNVPYKYIDSIRYNEFEMRDAVYYGNGTKAFYKYDVLQRLDNLRSETFFNENMQDIDYKYDAVSNITDIVNNAGILSNGLGGKFNNRYRYDDMYRLVYSEGVWQGNNPVNYELEMEYTDNGRILKKYVHGDSYEQTPYSGNQTPVHYDNDYHYTNTNQPNTLIEIDNGPHQYFRWDAKGNLIFHRNEDVPFKRFLCWDEQNRLQGVKDGNYYSYYQHDANGERVYKLTGKNVRQNRNGERRDYYHAGSTMLYASPYLVSNGKYYTKHYYAENERVASKIGGGGLSVIDMEDNPEMFCIHRDRSNDHFERVQECLDAQVYVEDSPLQLLYTWREIVQEETECYWYHPDHLGSSSWITFSDGKAVEHLHYMPWGEDFVSQRSTNWHTMYTFSAKEKDTETGLSYFGSRYYSSDLSIWLSVDPMSDKYPSLSPYVYCANNPIKLVDPNGEFPMSMHAQMVSNAFKNSSLSSGVIKKVKFGASVIADGLNVFTSFVHMDNMTGTSSIVSLYNAAKSAFTAQMGEENYMVAGVALHTVADFYSHSNYIDLYSEYADKNGLSMDIDDIPTFSDAMNDKNFMKFVEKSGGLKTGIFPGKGERSHKEMNMDSNDSSNGGSPYNEKNPTGPTKHEAARRVAQKELNNMVKEYEK